jgi:hypothetical protein
MEGMSRQKKESVNYNATLFMGEGGSNTFWHGKWRGDLSPLRIRTMRIA